MSKACGQKFRFTFLLIVLAILSAWAMPVNAGYLDGFYVPPVNVVTVDVPTGGCTANTDCNDNNVCTVNSCDTATGQCVFVNIGDPLCCNSAADCEDNDCSTLDFCAADNQCVHKAAQGVCFSNSECNDSNACTTDTCSVNTGVPSTSQCGSCSNTVVNKYKDADRDGYGNLDIPATELSCSGYVTNSTDCNDANAAIKPGASEICDLKDNNCNRTVDEGVTHTYFEDRDEDGYGNPSVTKVACTQPAGYVTNNTDCNDTNTAIHPGVTDNCDGIDNDCSSVTLDGSGDLTIGTSCDGADADLCKSGKFACTSGAKICAGDANILEVCDGKDNNCNGSIDEGVGNTYYQDSDTDSFGNPSVPKTACTKPAGYVTDKTDCDDGKAAIKPTATEICDGVDNNCNNQIDEGVKTTYYADYDGDGYGSPATTTACTKPVGYVDKGGDCNDSLASMHPGATEICNGNVNDDCDITNAEGSGDPLKGTACDGSDADKCLKGTYACISGVETCTNDVNIPEVCNGVDDDCDGVTDNGLVNKTYYQDLDGDGFGNTSVTLSKCAPPAGYVEKGGDCDDTNKLISPSATEICDTKDNNCSGTVDEGVTKTYFVDNDKDTYGNPLVKATACVPPAGYVTDNTDCSDGIANIHPGAAESCNGLDDDCDGTIDEGVALTGKVCIAGIWTWCGDGTKQSLEGCDDGNTVTETCDTYGSSCTVCDSTCKSITVNGPKCGDGVIQTPEACDGTAGIRDATKEKCTVTCTKEPLPYCGDGIIQSPETCDGTVGIRDATKEKCT
ncbi:MAG: hypothetical protein ACD_73C00801G0001, partial [uncultured bacterium]